MNSSTEDRWLSVDEIAAYLGIKRDTVYKWIERKSMPAHKVGILWKFKKEEIDEWVRSGGAAHKTIDLSVPLVNVNLALSSELLELTAKQRALRLPEIFARVTDSEFDPLLLDNLEILFDDHLKQDPLRLLHGISRNRTVVASWNGHAAARKLVYAEPGHAEHRNYEIGDVMIVQMSGQSLVGSAGE